MATYTHYADVNLQRTDIDLFWKVLAESPAHFPAAYFKENYFEAGTPYLNTFFTRKIKDAHKLSDLLNSPPAFAYYRSIKENTKKEQTQRQAIFAALEAFQRYYPSCQFCDIVFVIGALSTGGIIVEDAIIIGLELFAKAEDSNTDNFHPWVQNVSSSLDYLPAIVIHELVHVQQSRFLRTSPHQVQITRLLDLSMLEGAADFVCALVLDHKFPHDGMHALADPQEATIWQAFQRDMLKNETGDWLYKKVKEKNKLSNLGYYVGYKIVEAYYYKHGASTQALQDIIELEAPETLLQASGYAERF